MIQIYDPLTQHKIPLKLNQKISLYVCGNTVYDDAHIGHARVWSFFDLLVRYLNYSGHQVHYVRNITDIDDKIIQTAEKKGIPWHELTQIVIQKMKEEMHYLHLLPPHEEPKVTDHIQDIIHDIQKLIDKGHAYIQTDGVYLSLNHAPFYGEISHRSLQNETSPVGHDKKHQADFVLWKIVHQEPYWSSPWGNGRPGWHSECASLLHRFCGETVDIHGGGIDLCFPHHENENAQSKLLTNKPLANYWIHVGLLLVDGEKMSKSSGQYKRIKDVSPEILRLAFLRHHYRFTMDYHKESIHEIMKIATTIAYAATFSQEMAIEPHHEILEVLSDDFNTPKVVQIIYHLAKKVLSAEKEEKSNFAKQLRGSCVFLGLEFLFNQKLCVMFKLMQSTQYLQLNSIKQEAVLNQLLDFKNREKIQALIAERMKYRQTSKWEKADMIRQKLCEEYHVLIEDHKDSTQILGK